MPETLYTCKIFVCGDCRIIIDHPGARASSHIMLVTPDDVEMTLLYHGPLA